ncbi:MAG TPA: pyridoxamine 5'-phosphate oxidase family protein [Solirubrobacteraceae bacterium]|jgi:nitroimidazol reductase NimA-like FMN-containing flavoprotein (pyridoxamine 5'-phosphate oxidase superfamily)|nr:pyridoxamine 5'-phosphate oxidase family protein [Solirubrobacteraceae bacterium]
MPPPQRMTRTSNAPSPRTRVRRMPARADYERETVEAILDEGLVAHLGFAVDGQPYVVPTLHARVGEQVYFHGSSASRTVRALAAGVQMCLTVTLLDGLVLARSAVHHSVNYRSVVVLGQARAIERPAEKMAAIEAFTERLIPGRWDEVRGPTAKELKAIQVLALPLSEASAKLRAGPPVDDEEDYALDTWAGVIPLSTVAGEPTPDERLSESISSSPAARAWADRRDATPSSR